MGKFDCEIDHRAGRSHHNADSLSRRPCSQCGRAELFHEEDTEKPVEGRGVTDTTSVHGAQVRADLRVVRAQPPNLQKRLEKSTSEG